MAVKGTHLSVHRPERRTSALIRRFSIMLGVWVVTMRLHLHVLDEIYPYQTMRTGQKLYQVLIALFEKYQKSSLNI